MSGPGGHGMSDHGGTVVIFSGGLDSTVCLTQAVREARGPVLALSFDYHQRHRIELVRGAAIAAELGVERLVVDLDASQWGGSALTDPAIAVPSPDPGALSIPATYVPARNLIFLAIAMGVAEARDADAVVIGVNAVDYSGYPDCRPAFIRSFRETAALALKRGVQGRPVEVLTPLIDLSKAEIVRLGADLDAPLALTWSCYQSGPEPCRNCDSCELRALGFADAGLADPALDRVG